jgi:glycosyltransferase involved in cell wall biosynthesis
MDEQSMTNLTEISIQKNRNQLKEKQETPVFSILIPSWNNLRYLQLCIESIQRNSQFHHQIIVHINEGSDGTLEWVKSQGSIDFTFSEKNIGICYALNAAASLVSTDYVLYMNDDMYACPNWDRELHEAILGIGHPYFFISATAIEPVNTNNPCALILDCGKDIETFREHQLLEQFTWPRIQDWSGSTWPPNIVHKQVWDLVGGYSVEFSPGMYSDPDFSMKLWNSGIRLFRGISKSRVYHFGSRSVKRVQKNKGYFQFIEKWGITSDTFTRYYLKRGQPYTGLLSDPNIPAQVRMKNFIKRLHTLSR